MTESIHSISEQNHQREIRELFYEKTAQYESSGGCFESWFQVSTHEPFEAVDFLMSEIVEKGRCVGCAVCFYVCPVDVFDYVNERPIDSRHLGCVSCGLCIAVCPPAHLGSEQLSKFVIKMDYRDDGFGRYRSAALTRSKNPRIASKAQDGGVATTLLIQALESGEIDGAILGDAPLRSEKRTTRI